MQRNQWFSGHESLLFTSKMTKQNELVNCDRVFYNFTEKKKSVLVSGV